MSAYALWRPRSDCGPQCLPVDGGIPRVAPWHAAARMLSVLGVLLVAALALPVLALFPTGAARLLARALLAALGVGHAAAGRVPRRGALLVANHVSWLDVLVLLAYSPARLIAKHEVRDWPVIGWFAAASRCVFLDRSRPRALPDAVAGAAAALRAGAVVAVFPEGTTWCGRASGLFRPAMFQAAIDAGVPVVPVTLRFALADGAETTVAAYVGDDTLWASVNRVARARGLRVRLRAHPALHPADGASRRALARAAGCVSAGRRSQETLSNASATPQAVPAG